MNQDEARYMIRHSVAEFIRYCQSTLTLADITHAGASALISIHAQLDEFKALEDNERDHNIIERADIAKSEVRRGFPLLHGHSLMGAWGALEVAIDDVCVGWLAETDGRAIAESIRLSKVPLGEFFRLQDADRWRWVVEQVRRDQASILKPGVGQFEGLLNAVGLGGGCDDQLRHAMFLTKQYRNLIAHRGGRVDARFVADCPGLGVAEGDQIYFTYSQLQAALWAMIVYAESIIHRTVRARGGSPAVKLPPWVESTAKLVEDLKRVKTGANSADVADEDTTAHNQPQLNEASVSGDSNKPGSTT